MKLLFDQNLSFKLCQTLTDLFPGSTQVRLLGMGTSLHAALVGEHVIEDWVGMPARSQDASEFRYRRPTIGSGG